jgi:hypothetical protein
MIKTTLIFIICLFFNLLAFGQVGIGTAAPDAATLLHVDDGSGTKGVLIPKVQIDDLNTIAPLMTTPPVGTLVFNDAGAHPFGFHYWDGSKWIRLTGSDTDETIYTKDGILTSNRTMSMDGNTLTFKAGFNSSNSTDRLMTLTPPDPANIGDPYIFDTNHSYDFQTDKISALKIDDQGKIGIKQPNPQKELHISGNNSTIRIDGLSTTNNVNNIAADPVPVYVNNDGDLVTQPPLVQSFMLVNKPNFTPGFIFSSIDGSGLTGTLDASTFNLTQRSLVHYTYQISITVRRENGNPIVDGASRLFRTWFTVDGNYTNHYGYDTGTYTNNPGVVMDKSYASGFYYLSGSGYVELAAGSHTINLMGLTYGGKGATKDGFDYQITFGETTYDSIQAVIHR